MAKKPKETKSPTKKTAAKPTKKAFPMVAKADLNRLLDQCSMYQNRASTASGSMGELIREYADGKHLHPGAFSFIKRMRRMGEKDPGKLWLLLAHFDDMREKCGLDRLAKEQGQLLPAIAEDNEERGNVVDMPRDVQEQAGDAA